MRSSAMSQSADVYEVYLAFDAEGNYEVGTDPDDLRKRWTESVGPVDRFDPGFRVIPIMVHVPPAAPPVVVAVPAEPRTVAAVA
jgi:hypothetical protein